MKLDDASLKKLRKRMPSSYRLLAVQGMKAKGHPITAPAINGFFSGTFWNETLFHVLLDIAEKYEAQQKKYSQWARGEVKRNTIPA